MKEHDDGMGPPANATEVTCLHCGLTYSSDQMVYEDRFASGMALWFCGVKSCDGAGFGFDVFAKNDAMVIDLPKSRRRGEKAKSFSAPVRIGKSDEAKRKRGARRSH